MPRISITLSDDLHAQLKRIADTSQVSIASTVRAVLSDVVPRLTNVVDYLGTGGSVTPSDLDQADAWLQDLNALLGRAPESLQGSLGGLHLDVPPTAGGRD